MKKEELLEISDIWKEIFTRLTAEEETKLIRLIGSITASSFPKHEEGFTVYSFSPNSPDFLAVLAYIGNHRVFASARLFAEADDRPCVYAAKRGDREFIELARRCECPWSVRVTNTAAEKGHEDLLLWLIENGCPWNPDMFFHLAYIGRVSLLKYLMKNYREYDDRAILKSVEGGQVETFKWFLKNNPNFMDNKDMLHAIFNTAALYGRASIIGVMKENDALTTLDPLLLPPEMGILAAQGGHTHILEYLRSIGYEMDYEKICQEATKWGRDKVLQWVHDHGVAIPPSVYWYLPYSGKVDIGKWLVKIGCLFDVSAKENDAVDGFEMSQEFVGWWTSYKKDSIYPSGLLDRAVIMNDASLYEWAVQRGAFCRPSTLKYLAEAGQIEILEAIFSAESQDEGTINLLEAKESVYIGAINGTQPVIHNVFAWAKKMGIVPTKVTYMHAISHASLVALVWLHDNFPLKIEDRNDPAFCIACACHGTRRVMNWLLMNNFARSSQALIVAIENNKIDLLKWMIEVNFPLNEYVWIAAIGNGDDRIISITAHALRYSHDIWSKITNISISMMLKLLSTISTTGWTASDVLWFYMCDATPIKEWGQINGIGTITNYSSVDNPELKRIENILMEGLEDIALPVQ